jgi:hypothetical protein
MHSPIFKRRASATQLRSRIWTAACVTCALLLQACGATLPVCQPASSELPSPPSQSTPQPAQPYSKTWQLQVDDWRNVVETSRARLKGTQLMRD